jgi:thymidylate kinase
VPSVELAGIPGGGKTTLLKEIRRPLREAGIHVHGNPERAESPPVGWRPSGFERAERLIRRCDQADKLRQLTRRVWWRMENEPNGFHAEAMVHQAWRIGWLSGRDPRRLVPVMPITDIVIVIGVDPSIAAQRVRGKDSPGPINRALAHSPPATWAEVVASYERLLKLVAKRTRLLRIVNDGDDPSRVARKIVATASLNSAGDAGGPESLGGWSHR